MPRGLEVHWERIRLLPKSSKEMAICSNPKKMCLLHDGNFDIIIAISNAMKR